MNNENTNNSKIGVESTDDTQNSGVVKLVLVVGFHHKKGAQIEYVYPDNIYTESELLAKYKNLPHLCLPDGAHNFNEETTYLLFPKGEYAVSHFRQISKADLKQDKLNEEVTRNTVQKAVVVICQSKIGKIEAKTGPKDVSKQGLITEDSSSCANSAYLLGPVAKKLAIISKAYFEERDFSQTEVLKDLYDQFQQNARLLTKESIYFGISVRSAVKLLRHDILRLFKLILLEKRVIIYGNGTSKSGNLILALISLFPKTLESNILQYNDDQSIEIKPAKVIDETDFTTDFHSETEPLNPASKSNSFEQNLDSTKSDSISIHSLSIDHPKETPIIPHEFENSSGVREQSSEFDKPAPKRQFTTKKPDDIKFDGYGHPLGVYTHGNYCLPYTCLGELEKLEKTEATRSGYLVGSSNELMKIKWKGCADVIIDLEANTFNIKSNILKHQVDLTNADLRFIDDIVEKVEKSMNSDETSENEEVVEYEGGDEWIRERFASYINSFLAVTRYDGNPQLVDDFNSDFLQSWKSNTVNSSLWYAIEPQEIETVQPVHPSHQGTLQSANILSSPTEALEYTSTMLSREIDNTTLKLKYALKSTSGGRKVTAAALDAGVLLNDGLKNAGEGLTNAASVTGTFTASLTAGLAEKFANLNTKGETSGRGETSGSGETCENGENAELDNSVRGMSSMISQERLSQASSMLSNAGEDSKKLLTSGFSFLSSKFQNFTGAPEENK
jgi:hypothetical protein